MHELLDRYLGAGWNDHATDPAVWSHVNEIPAAELWAVRQRQRAAADRIRARAQHGRPALTWETREYVEAAARAFDPEVLTIGFARRVATYKRLDLLTRDPAWTLSLLGGKQPVQVVLGGKAHPRTRMPSARCARCSS